MKKYFLILLMLSAFVGPVFLMQKPHREELIEIPDRPRQVEEEAAPPFTEAEAPVPQAGITKEVIEKLVKKWKEKEWLKVGPSEDGSTARVSATSDLFEVQLVWGSKTLGYLFELWSRAVGATPVLRRFAKKGPRRRYPYFVKYLESHLLKGELADCDKIDLHFEGATVSDAQIEKLKNLQNVSGLFLDGCPNITGSFVRKIRGRNLLSGLERLGLRAPNLNFENVRSLPLRRFETLRVSNLSKTVSNVSDFNFAVNLLNGSATELVAEGEFEVGFEGRSLLNDIPDSVETLELHGVFGEISGEVADGHFSNLKRLVIKSVLDGERQPRATLHTKMFKGSGVGESLEDLVLGSLTVDGSMVGDGVFGDKVKRLFISNCIGAVKLFNIKSLLSSWDQVEEFAVKISGVDVDTEERGVSLVVTRLKWADMNRVHLDALKRTRTEVSLDFDFDRLKTN